MHREFETVILGMYGERGRQWLASLPELCERLEREWSISIGRPFEPLSYNYVAEATPADGTPAVVKLGMPYNLIVSEAACLQLWEAAGAVRLLRYEAELGAMLLERIEPGHTAQRLFAQGRDDDAVEAAIQCMRRLHRPAPGGVKFPTLAEWFEALDRVAVGALPEELLDDAKRIARELLESSPSPMLLHGDLHHFNLLFCRKRGWLAIDPQGVLGDPAFEAAAFFHNPFELFEADAEAINRRRVKLFAEGLGAAPERIAAWGFAQQMLSAAWDVEDGGGLGLGLPAAKVMRRLL